MSGYSSDGGSDFDELGRYVGRGSLRYWKNKFGYGESESELDSWEDEDTDSDDENISNFNFDDPSDMEDDLETRQIDAFKNAFKKWEDTGMVDSHLLNFQPLVEVEELTWCKLSDTQVAEVRYQDLYSLARQLTRLLSAWRARVERVGGVWGDLEQRNKFVFLPLRQSEENEEEVKSPRRKKMDMLLEQVMQCKKGVDLEGDDRARYSVGCLMDVLGCSKTVEVFTKEVDRVKKLVHSLLLRVLGPCLPSLPYTAMVIILKEVCEDGRGLENIRLMVEEVPSQLVERRYIARLYQTLEGLYSGIREVMFKHPMETAFPWYASKFKFMRRRQVNTISLLETLHEVQGGNVVQTWEEDDVVGGRNVYTEQPQEVVVHQEEDYAAGVPEVQVLLPIKKTAVTSGGGHLFLPIIDSDGRTQISVQDLSSGQVDKIPVLDQTALLDLKKEGMISLCTPLAATESLVAISLSLGYPRNHMSARDIIRVFNWVERKLVWHLEVQHSSQLKEAARRYEERYELDELEDEDLHDILDNDFEHVFRIVLACSDNGSVYLAHCEDVYAAETGAGDEDLKHVRLYKQGVEDVYMEFNDIMLMDFHRGLMLYRQMDGGSDQRSIVTILLDIESGEELQREVLQNVQIEEGQQDSKVSILKGQKLPIKNISHVTGPSTVLEYSEGTLRLFSFVEGEEILTREINLEVLENEIKLEMETGDFNSYLNMRMVGENLLHVTCEKMCLSVVSDTVFWTVSKHLLVDLTTQPRTLTDLFVVDKENRKNRDNLNLVADMVVARGKTLTLLRVLPDDRDHGDELLVKSIRLRVDREAKEVVMEDEELARQTLEQIRLKEEREGKQGCLEQKRLGGPGERYTGTLLNWKGSFGFIKFDQHPEASDIFVHISDIRKPRPCLRRGLRLEFMVEVDQQKNKTKAVIAQAI